MSNARTEADQLLEDGWMCYEKGDFVQAVALLQKAASALPSEELAHYRLGFCFRALRQHQAALESFRAALGICPDDAWAQFQVAKELVYLGRRREALTEYAQALEINSRFAEAYNDLAAILAMLGYYDLSTAVYAGFSVLADISVEASGVAPISSEQFRHSTDILKRMLGNRYEQIHARVFKELGDPQRGEVHVEGFDRLAVQIVTAVRRIVEDGAENEVGPPQ